MQNFQNSEQNNSLIFLFKMFHVEKAQERQFSDNLP